MSGGGFGSGGFGSLPWGSFALSSSSTPPADFDIFCFFDSPTSMGLILSDPDVTTFDSGGQVSIDLDSDLVLTSGGGESSDTAIVEVSTISPASRTLEATIFIDAIPPDFTDLAHEHIFIGTTTGGSTCAGFFISAAGLAYVGGVHYSGPARTVAIDTPITLIPGSNLYISTGQYLVFRIAIDHSTGTLYLYVSPKADADAGNHILRAILPTIDAAALATPPFAVTTVSVAGSSLEPSFIRVDELCMSSHVLIANLAPVADAGADRSVELCTVILLDGTASFDPEGANLLYLWQLIDAPPTSAYGVFAGDGNTFVIDSSGFTDRLYSAALAGLLNPAVVGDVILVAGGSHVISAFGADGHGAYAQFTTQDVPDSLTNVSFKLLRQNGIYQDNQAIAKFMPDVAGFYRFNLIVSDGLLFSEPAVIVVNVLESLLPRGVVPDVSFIFGLMSDFWGLVEDRERVTTLWSGVAQVAAGELLTLWQHDYAKSLRDVQRQFTRKWLHYDLLLPEPIPELTKVRAVYGGLYSVVAASTFSYTYSNTNLTLISPALSKPASFDFPPGSTRSFPTGFAADLDMRLKMIDTRFSVRAVTWSGGEVSVCIYAPFAFQVLNCTLPTITDVVTAQPGAVFHANAFNPQPSGDTSSDLEATRSGSGIGSNTYRVFSRIDFFGVQENDFLILDSVAYRIASVVPDPGGNEQADIILKETLPSTVSHAWMVASSVSSELLDFWNGLVSAGDSVFLEIAEANTDIPSSALQYEFFRTTVLGVNESLPNMLPISLVGLPADVADVNTGIFLAKVLRRRYVPISSLVIDVPTLSEKIVVVNQTDEEAVLRRNVDYTLETIRNGTGIHFVTTAEGGVLDVWEAQDPPARLWAEFTYLDNRPTIEQNFGIPAGFTLDDLALLPDGLDYLSAVRGLWYAYFNGPTLKNIRIGTQILLGLPFAEEAGTIEEIRTDFSPTLGRLLLRDTANTAIVRSYTYPRTLDLEVNATTGQKYAVGDSVVQFAPLVEGAEVTDYVKDPRWFLGILNQGVFSEVEKYFRFLVRVDSAAFHLAALLAVRDFVLKIKPTYTYPFIVVESGGDRIDDISIDDTVTSNVTVNLVDNLCSGYLGAATIFDDYRAAGGAIRNQFDTDSNPSTPRPTFPTSDTPILWAFDKAMLCPEDSVVAEVSTRFSSSGPIMFGMCFLFGQSYVEVYKFLKTGATITVPASPSLLAILTDPNDATAGIVATAGNIVAVKIRTTGIVHNAPNDTYVVYIGINGVPPVSGTPFTMPPGANGSAMVTLGAPIAVSPADVVTAFLQVASGSSRVEAWTILEATVYHSDTPTFVFGQTLAPGTYRTIRQLSP